MSEVIALARECVGVKRQQFELECDSGEDAGESCGDLRAGL